MQLSTKAKTAFAYMWHAMTLDESDSNLTALVMLRLWDLGFRAWGLLRGIQILVPLSQFASRVILGLGL